MQSVFEESLPRPSVDAVRGEMMPSCWLLQPIRRSGQEATRVVYLLQVRHSWSECCARRLVQMFRMIIRVSHFNVDKTHRWWFAGSLEAFKHRSCSWFIRQDSPFVLFWLTRSNHCCQTVLHVFTRCFFRWISGLRPSLSDCWEPLPGDRPPSSPISTFSSLRKSAGWGGISSEHLDSPLSVELVCVLNLHLKASMYLT